MAEYTPTTEEVRHGYAENYARTVEYHEAGFFEFDRWLAAHDAEVRAGVVGEEPEWEYGSSAIEDDGEGPRPLSEDRDYWPAGITAHASEPDEHKARQIIQGWENAALVRRRKAGPWVPVKQEEVNPSVGD